MPRKTPYEKLITKINALDRNEQIICADGQVIVNGNVHLFNYNEASIQYGRNRYYPSKKEEIAQEGFDVVIPLSDENLNLLSSNIANPPKRARQIIDLLSNLSESNLTSITLGAGQNQINEDSVELTKELFDFLVDIDKNEATNKRTRFLNRIGPTLNNELGIEVEEGEENIDLSLVLREIIERGDFSQEDILSLSDQLDSGNYNKAVIESRIIHQVDWLIQTLENILEEDTILVPRAKELGSELFGYTKVSITGPENLMEKILTDYGQYTLFGVPALLNTNKYVIQPGHPRIQFDLVLVDHLGEVEIVELKRPDKYLLEYGGGRNKFYPCKDLAIAISQTERYLTAVYDKNNERQLINGQTLKEFIDSEIGDTLSVESIRPKGVIVMGSYQKICKPYNSLTIAQRNSVTEAEYNANAIQAYKEIKDSLKNIKIITYSELLETARTRLMQNEQGEEE